MANKAVDLGADSFTFTRERVARAIEYARVHRLTREWRDEHDAGEGLCLRVGPKKASFYARIRVAGKMTGKRLGPAEGPDRLAVEGARKELHRHRCGILPEAVPKGRRRSAGSRHTIGAVFARYIEDHVAGTWLPGRCRGNPTDTTMKHYRKLYKSRLERFASSTLEAFAKAMPSIHADIRKVAPTQADRFRQLVKNLFNYAADKDLWAGNNPAIGDRKTGLIPVFTPPNRTRWLTCPHEWIQSLSLG